MMMDHRASTTSRYEESPIMFTRWRRLRCVGKLDSNEHGYTMVLSASRAPSRGQQRDTGTRASRCFPSLGRSTTRSFIGTKGYITFARGEQAPASAVAFYSRARIAHLWRISMQALWGIYFASSGKDSLDWQLWQRISSRLRIRFQVVLYRVAESLHF